MDAQALIRRLLEQRESRVELQPGVFVTVRRPDEAGLPAWLKDSRQADTYLQCVVGWSGMTEAVLLGPAVGGSEPIEFDAQLWLTAARDRGEWIQAISAHLAQQVEAHMSTRALVAKNSKPSSPSSRARKAPKKPS